MKEHIYCVITTSRPEDWKELKPKITHDPEFKAWSMLSSWWQYKKLPVLLLKDISDLKEIEETSRLSIELNSIYVD